MKTLENILSHNTPAFIRKIILKELFKATADGFGCPVPLLGQLSFESYLQAYARFTCEQAEIALSSGQEKIALKTRLFQNALPLGNKLRRWFRINTVDEIMRISSILYRAINIDIEGNSLGEITIKRCYFSEYYSNSICDLISAMDDGIFSGLSGGRRLVFKGRITEGGFCCRAKLLSLKEEM